MKVNLAAQAISGSVADAIEFCNKTLKLKQFEGSEGTVNFIRIFDRLFDILNSRNPFAKGYKSPLKENNQKVWLPFLLSASSYIKNLKDNQGKSIVSSRRKTGFIGFLAAIESVKCIFADLVTTGRMKYILTYKFSQDHLELFFGAVRSAGGFNNNPTCGQFVAAYKRLLMRSHIKGGSGNCKSDSTVMLYLDETYTENKEDNITTTALKRKYDLDDRAPLKCDHDYCDTPNVSTLSEFKDSAISYIAGYVVRMVKRITSCKNCCDALESKSFATSFVSHKNRGGLVKASMSVIRLCRETEKRIQRMLITNKGKLPQGKGIVEAIKSSILLSINMRIIFRDLHTHMFDTAINENHIIMLTKEIVRCYCTIRLNHLAKNFTAESEGKKIRKVLNKLVLFKHQ